MAPRTVALHAGQLLQPVPGGIGRYVRALTAALPAAGVVPLPFAAGPRPVGMGEPWHDLGRPRGALRYEVWHRLRQPEPQVPGDVVHATSLAVPPSRHRPLVVTVHDLVFLRQPEHLTSRGVSFHRRGLDLARAEAAAVVVPTEWGRQDLLREGFAPGRVHVAHHGVTVGPPPAPDVCASVLRHLGVRQPFVLFASTIEPRKGVLDLLAAHAAVARSSPGLGLVLAGPQGWGEVPDLHRPGVVATGHVGDRELDVLYRSAVCLAHPARYEGFGLQVAEAMARGCPVVTTDAACLPEVAGGAADLVPVGDVDALAGALRRLVEDGDHRAERAAAGLSRAAALTWAASAEAHVGAYEAALATGPRVVGGRRSRGGAADGPLPARSPTGGGGADGGRSASGAHRPSAEALRPGPTGTQLPGPVAVDVSAIPSSPAGAGIYVVELVRALAAADAVELVVVSRRDDGRRWRELAPRARMVTSAPGPRPLRLAWEQAVAPVLARRLAPAVWHGPHYTLPLARRGPTVVTVHDLTFFDHPDWHEPAKVAYFTRMIRASARRADAIVSVSERTAERLRELLRPEAPVLAIPHGVDHGRFAPQPPPGAEPDAELLARLGVRAPFVAFAGTVEPRKGLPGLIRAFSRIAGRHPELALVLAGLPGWGSDEVEAARRASPVADRIHLLGYVDPPVVPALFRSAAAVAYVPHAEGFGLNALEAMACGAALVTTADTPMADLVGDAAVLVPAGDEVVLAEALDGVVAGGPDVTRRRAQGPGVAAPWTWERCAAAHAHAYRLAAAAHPG